MGVDYISTIALKCGWRADECAPLIAPLLWPPNMPVPLDPQASEAAVEAVFQYFADKKTKKKVDAKNIAHIVRSQGA